MFFTKSYINLSDEELMRYVSKGNTKAFEVLYDRYAPLMYRYFFRMLGQHKDIAEDFTQDIFIKIIEKPHLFDNARNFKAWMYCVASNMCKNQYRNKKAIVNIDNQEFKYTDNIEQGIDDMIMKANFLQAIEQLSEVYKECFILRFLEELSIKEIAEIAKIPEGTVKSRLHEATKQVRDFFKVLQ